MWRWFSRKQSVAPPVPPGAETAAEAETGFETVAEPTVWAPTTPMSAPPWHEMPEPPSGATAPAVATVAPVRDEDATRRASELRRLAALQARGETAYQYVVDTAARICQTPLAAIVLLDGDTLWFKASRGIDVESTPAANSPCRLAIDSAPDVTVLHDIDRDPRFSGYVLMATHPGVRYYAGAPLITSQGVTVGTVCVADHEARELSPVQLRTLQLLARQTTLLLEARAP